MKLRFVITASLTLLLGASVFAQKSDVPEEFLTLITAYTSGHLTVDQLRGVCQWSPSEKGVEEELVYARRQNAKFCEGFLTGSLEFALLDSAVLESLTGSQNSDGLSHCDSSTTPTMRTQLLANSKLLKKNKDHASDVIFSLLLACRR
ncbi:hypothetical protein [Pseudomonas chlororaphis]|uniref:hypothetical protein n=1 Tax=Pseudomonas chlororaphis TaxID=587753 RepID=UPI000F589D9A|nr:hypothetical protein [Pseudomonas chlororaphis]